METVTRAETHIIDSTDELIEHAEMAKCMYNTCVYYNREIYQSNRNCYYYMKKDISLYSFVMTLMKTEFSDIKINPDDDFKIIYKQDYLNNTDLINKIKQEFVDEDEESDNDYVWWYEGLSSETRYGIAKKTFQSFKSFDSAFWDYWKNPKKYRGRPKPPNYCKKDIKELYFRSPSTKKSKRPKLKNDSKFKLPKGLSDLKIHVYNNTARIGDFQISPYYDKFKVFIPYEKKVKNLGLNKNNVIGIDIGVDILCAITPNNPDNPSILINGKPLKFINHNFNKKLSKEKSWLKKRNNRDWSNKLDRISRRRTERISNYFYKTANYIIEYCKKYNIGKIVIGKNKLWKQNSDMGKRNNQNFISIPFSKLINQIESKAEEYGIVFETTEESYTSKVDHFALEEMKKQKEYLGKRDYNQGLFISSTGKAVHEDLNGALGILRKTNDVSDDQIINIKESEKIYNPNKINSFF